MIIDFYAADGTWLDCCDAGQNDVQRIAAILTAKYGPVRRAQREDVRYVKGAVGETAEALSFADWLETV